MTISPIFVSHSHKDNVACRELVAFLAAQFPGADIFFDQSDLHGGDDWMQRIQREVVARPNFIVVLSRHSVVAEWVREETNLALSRAISDKVHRKIIPVVVDAGLQRADIDYLAPLLTTRQILDLATNAASAQEDLVRVLRGEISGEAPRVDPVQVADLERARDLATQTQTEVAAQHWLNAITIGRRAVKLPGNERDAALWGDLGLALCRADMLPDALHALETALNLNRYRADLWRLKAQTLAKQSQNATDAAAKARDLDAAADAWEEAEVWTGAPKAKLEVQDEHADALIAAHRWDAAAFVVRKGLELAPNDPAWLARQKSATLGPIIEQYNTAVQARAWQNALAACDAAIAKYSTDAAWPNRRKQIQAQIEQEQRAIEEAKIKAQAERRAKLLPDRLRTLGFTVAANADVIIPPTVEVPAGPFTMGSDKRRDRQARDDEQQVQVNLAAFRIGTFPVTVAEYACAVNAKVVPEPPDGYNVTWQVQLSRLDHPVVCVSWLNVVAYAEWLSKMTGEQWRLPTEAEWEKAARGTDGRIYPWGDQWDKARANTNDGGPGTTTPVGTYRRNGPGDPSSDVSPYGASDMAGNVWEWTSSMYQKHYSIQSSENISDRTNNRVLRGGAWYINPQGARAALRNRNAPGDLGDLLGARLVRVRV